MSAISRKQFLRGDFFNRHAPIRPPWSVQETVFLETCSQCHDCIKSCPESIIFSSAGRYPEVNFSHGECTFCHQCASACSTGALNYDEAIPAWSLKAQLTQKCLSNQNIHCMACRDQCETEAIYFIHEPSHSPKPFIDTSLCTGCGACFAPCPSAAIELNYFEV